MSDRILVTRPSMPPLDEYVREIEGLWESHWLTNMGEKHKAFEEDLRRFLGIQNVALFVNGHSALECILEAMQLGTDGRRKVITTPFTFASTTHAIVRVGLEPVFADISPKTYTLDPESVDALVDDEICAILPVHVYGMLCDVDSLSDIAHRHDLKLVYDAAHAFGVTREGVSAAAFGDASMFSFHATKVFNSIEGGAVSFADPSLGPSLEQWKNFGITSQEDVVYVGGNAKMNEFAASMGICNLRHLPEEIAKRRVIAERYRERLSVNGGLTLAEGQEGVASNYAYFPVVFEDAFGATRDDVFESLHQHDIYSRKYFHPLISDYACYEGRFDSSRTPVAQEVARRVLTLPMYADLSLADVDRICDVVLGCAR